MSYRTPTSQLANCGFVWPSCSCFRLSGNAIVCLWYSIKFQFFSRSDMPIWTAVHWLTDENKKQINRQENNAFVKDNRPNDCETRLPRYLMMSSSQQRDTSIRRYQQQKVSLLSLIHWLQLLSFVCIDLFHYQLSYIQRKCFFDWNQLDHNIQKESSQILAFTERTTTTMTMRLPILASRMAASSLRTFQVREFGQKVTGTVKWFNTTKGFGFIEPADKSGDCFVHQTQIKSDGFRSLAEGETVEFEIIVSEEKGGYV